jgi:hypothetical protein
MKTPDLSIRPANSSRPTTPQFRGQQRYVAALAFAAGIRDIFTPQAAVTVQWVLVQTSAACTIQLYLNSGEPIGAALSVGAGAVIRFAGTFLANNDRLQFSVSAATTLNFEVVYLQGVCPEAVLNATTILPTSSAIADAPLGTEAAIVVRTIARKKSSTETTTPLAANGVYTGPWHDTELDGTMYVNVFALSNQASTSGGFVLQESDDPNNASFTRNIISVQALANTLKRLGAQIKARYWRVFYTNGPTLQTTWEVTYCAFNYVVMPDAATGLANSDVSQAVVVSTTPVNGAQNITDNLTTVNFLASSNLPTPVAQQMYGGKFSGTASPALQGVSYARTPTIFKQVSTVATGSTAIWTPAASNKFRLLAYRIQVTALAKAAVAADLVIDLLDAAATIGQKTLCTIPVAAAGNGVILDTGWVSLGTFGILSALANNALNLNLSFALTGGLVNCNVQGVEE